MEKTGSERAFVKRVLSVLSGRAPIPREVGLRLAAQLKRDRERQQQVQSQGGESLQDEGEEVEEGLYITDRSLCGSARQREMVVQYLMWVLQHELAYPLSAIERQSWTKHCHDGSQVHLTNLVVSIPGLLDAEGSKARKRGDIVVGAHHDVQNNQSHCWMPAKSKPGAKNARHHHHHHHKEAAPKEETEDEYVVTAGADDNGSGVTGCLALLRRLAQQAREDGWRPRHTIRVALFDGEEPGSKCGLTEGSAEFYRRSCIKGAERPIDFALVIDMIGALPSDPSVGLVLSHQEVDKDWLNTCATAATPELLVTPADANTRRPRGLFCLYASDSRIFAAAGLPVVLMCNTHLGALPPFYHNELDTTDNIDWPFLLRCVDLAEAIVKSRDAGEK